MIDGRTDGHGLIDFSRRVDQEYTRWNSKASELYKKKQKIGFLLQIFYWSPFEIVPFALNTMICTIKKIIE